MHKNLLLSLLLVTAGLPGAGLAQGDAGAEATAACLTAAATEADRHACIGKAAAACLAAVKDATDMDAAICLNDETVWWKGRLEDSYDRLMVRAGELDAKFAANIAKGEPKMTDDLANLQSAWKAWSEQTCIFQAMLHRGKPDRTRVASTCLIQRTAEQALMLDAALAATAR